MIEVDSNVLRINRGESHPLFVYSTHYFEPVQLGSVLKGLEFTFMDDLVITYMKDDSPPMPDPQEGYLDRDDIFDVLDTHPAPVHRDGSFCVAVDGCRSVSEPCECQISCCSVLRLMET